MTTKNNHGGARKGAGAKKVLPEGAKPRPIRLTDEEFEKVKEYVKKIRC